MNRADATIEELFGLLPELEEFEFLRLRLVAGAVVDPRREWDSSADYATVDRRLLTPEAVERVLRESEAALHEHAIALHADLSRVLRSFWTQDRSEVIGLLLAMGGRLDDAGWPSKALQCYRVSLRLALPLPDKAPQIEALKRIARVVLGAGDFQEALSYYGRSAELASNTGDLRGEVIARTGVGNVRLWQGLWSDAERCYQDALDLTRRAPDGLDLDLETAQLYNNLGNISVRQARLDEAEEWLARAFQMWESLSSPVETARATFFLGQLREAQDRRAEAIELYTQALAMPVASSVRAVVAIDLATALLRSGNLTEAVRVSRAAEEHAIASRSPYTLGYMYQGRGRLASARGEEDGFIFFEKALQIARETGYPFLEAETLLDYARLRIQSGGRDEAKAYLEHAREMFIQLGAVRLQAEAEELLASIDTPPPRAAAAD